MTKSRLHRDLVKPFIKSGVSSSLPTVVWHHLHGLRVSGPARRNPLVPVRGGHLVHRDRPLELRVPAGHPRGAESAHQLDLDGMKKIKLTERYSAQIWWPE